MDMTASKFKRISDYLKCCLFEVVPHEGFNGENSLETNVEGYAVSIYSNNSKIDLKTVICQILATNTIQQQLRIHEVCNLFSSMGITDYWKFNYIDVDLDINSIPFYLGSYTLPIISGDIEKEIVEALKDLKRIIKNYLDLFILAIITEDDLKSEFEWFKKREQESRNHLSDI